MLSSYATNGELLLPPPPSAHDFIAHNDNDFTIGPCTPTLCTSTHDDESITDDEGNGLTPHFPSGASRSEDDIDAFVWAAEIGTLTPQGVTTAVVTKGIPVNGRHSTGGFTALHRAVANRRRELVIALLAVGADPNVKNNSGMTSVFEGAAYSSADILQLLIDSDGSVNEPDNYGQTPLIALIMCNIGNAAVRLEVLFACPKLDLDATCEGKTAEEWAATAGHFELAEATAIQRRRSR
jgi:ankyrin repeat protein